MLAGGIASSSAFGFGVAGVVAHGGDPCESWTCTESDLEAWLKNARTGDRFVYARGPSLIQGAAAAKVKALRERGEISSHNQRNRVTGDLEYIVIRNRIRVEVLRAPVCTPDMMAVLVELQDDAQNHRRCRSDAELADAAGITADQAKWQLKKLEAAKMIERRTVPAPGDPRFRVVRVVATGAETAGPK